MRGTLSLNGVSIITCGDHPRVCGEHHAGEACGVACQGSSPRMRGTHTEELRSTAHVGIIPAYAGNTRSRRRARTVSWDHPRVCGEHRSGVAYALDELGSSPRMRGTRCYGVVRSLSPGIIPAYAGNTSTRPLSPSCRRDHPRVCGEHIGRERFRAIGAGSSPRMRGTLRVICPPFCVCGIIPAYAGNTERYWPPMTCGGDHPRVCGEHLIWSATHSLVLGSSPRMRGTRPVRRPRFRSRGIIPAYAGNTSLHRSDTNTRDHPRVCGEHVSCARAAASTAGSSPRMRGTH